MNKFYLSIVCFLILSVFFGQVGVNTTNPDPSSALDINSTSGGLLIPKMTLLQKNAINSPATGLLIYQTDQTQGFYYYDGSSWTILISTSNLVLTSANIQDGTITSDDLSTGISTTKLGGGSVSDTELGYLDGLTSNAQTQLNGLDGRLTTNTGSISSNALDISSNTSSITTLSSTISNLTDSDTTYSSGSGLTLNGTEFGLDSSVVTSTYTGDVIINGTLTATNFVGDGSGLTGVSASILSNDSVTSANIQDGTITSSVSLPVFSESISEVVLGGTLKEIRDTNRDGVPNALDPSFPCVTKYDFNNCILENFSTEYPGNISFVSDYDGCSLQVVRPGVITSDKEFGLGTYEIMAKASTYDANQGIKLLNGSVTIDVRPDGTDDEGWILRVNDINVAGDNIDAAGRINNMPVSYPNWYKIKIFITDSKIKLWLDDTVLADINNYGVLNESQGIVSIGGFSTSRYDNLVYTPLENTSKPVLNLNQTFDSPIDVASIVNSSENLVFYKTLTGSEELVLTDIISTTQKIYVSQILNNCESERAVVQVNISTDTDGDGIANSIDNCPSTANADQADADGDGVGDLCDNAPNTPNADQRDTDGDGEGDVIDIDDDGDGVPDTSDDFPLDSTESSDTDGDGIGDNADTDDDSDGILDSLDNCRFTANSDQLDTDGDGQGDVCDLDDDNDGFSDSDEIACGSDPLLDSSMPLDTDSDGSADCIDLDDDDDGFSDEDEIICGTDPLLSSSKPIDTDSDGVANCIDDDDDNDGVLDLDDAFPLDASETTDTDGDGIGNNSDTDDDGDEQLDVDEITCGSDPLDNNSVSLDTDTDGIPDCVDPDDDGDGVIDTQDAFPLDPTEWTDTDQDGIGNNADTDDDNDGYSDLDELSCESDPLDKFSKPSDIDNDGIPDCIDSDRDGDGVLNTEDAFPDDDRESVDTDGDGLGDNFEADDDNDGILDEDDAFPLDPNESKDSDGDGIGDNADLDDNNDGFEDIRIYVSGLLTPKSNNIEKTWLIINIEKYPNARIKVYNRNGQEVFNAINYKSNWNGIYQSSDKPLPAGSYYYIIDLNDATQEVVKGWLYITY